jgi:threonylcarbamoyladenosine tRNA methylthiotransferase MtaB
MAVTETAAHLVPSFNDRVRAFVEIQNGCDHRCTFCVIPFGRGNNRSVPAGRVVEEIRTLVERGTREVVLTGVDITGWGGDLPGRPPLGYLVRSLLDQVPDLPRLRLTSLDVAEVDETLYRAIAEEPRLMPHLHLSLQSGDAMILKRMKRRHQPEQAVAFCDLVRRLRPDAVFGADLIAGFPTETEAMFEATLRHVDACGLSFLHVFPYSPRPGTPAARMPQVTKADRKERAARLREAGDTALQAFLASRIGARAQVLVEQKGAGRTEQYAPARLTTAAEDGALVEARLVGIDNGELLAEAA